MRGGITSAVGDGSGLWLGRLGGFYVCHFGGWSCRVVVLGLVRMEVWCIVCGVLGMEGLEIDGGAFGARKRCGVSERISARHIVSHPARSSFVFSS